MLRETSGDNINLTENDKQCLELLQKNNNIKIDDYYALEWLRCRKNPLYFIQNYMYIEETGGVVKYTPELLRPKIRRVIKILNKYHKCVFMASRQLGKALAIDTPIPKFNGQWITMGEVKIGDELYDDIGNKTTVINVTEFMFDRPCYKITFTCGQKVIADENHLWRIISDNLKISETIVSTKQLFDISSKKGMPYILNRYFTRKSRHTKRYYIKSVEPCESIPVRCIQVDNKDGMFLFGKEKIATHNSTIAAGYLAWSTIFFPKNKAIILNFKKHPSIKNLGMVKFIIENLPDWLKWSCIQKTKSERLTYLELRNGSRIDAFYPSSTSQPTTIARSLTCSCIYIDKLFCRFKILMNSGKTFLQEILS